MKTITKDINHRAFNALLNGTKRIEIRARKVDLSENSFDGINQGDCIVFRDLKSNEKLKATVKRKTLYRSVKELLETEGTEFTLSSTNDIKEGIESIESIKGYKELIEKNGVFAIELSDVITSWVEASLSNEF